MAQKLFADSNRASLREIIENNAQWGETPVVGRTRARRFTSSSITASKETTSSEEIRDDRMVSSVIETSASSGGEVNWEFAAGGQDEDFQRVLMGAWTRPMEFDVFRGKTVAIVANNQIAIQGGDFRPYFTVGRRLKTSGFTTPTNNDYLQISALGFAGGVTTITVTVTTLVAEAGSAFTTVADANDVVILKNTGLRIGNTARTIDSNGTNAFAAAVAAKQLLPGQRIFVEGFGYETGTITVGVLADADTVTISDGTNIFKFEAQNDTDVADGLAHLFAIGANATESAANLAAKINALRVAGELNVSATAAAAVVTLTNLDKDGGSITGDASYTIVDFTGGDKTHGGFYTLVNVTDDALTVDRDVPVVAAGKKITIKGSMLRNPGNSADITAQSATLETGFQDVGQYFLVNGLRAGNMSLEVSAGAIITGNTSYMGRATSRSAVAKLTNDGIYDVLDAAATENVSATANVGNLSVNGVEVATAIQSISLQIEGNLRAQQAVGSKFPIGISAGRLNVSGTINAYFADGAMYDRFLNHETVGLAFPVVDPDKNTYYFTIPAFKVSSDPVAPGGTDQDVMEQMEFTAFRDQATACMMQIDRFSSTNPVTAL